MALLLEAFCVYVKIESIDSKFLGGRQAFAETVRTDMFVHDEYIFSSGFQTYQEAKEYYDYLLSFGLTPDDIAIASQIEKILTDSPWLKFSEMGFNTGKQMANITVCYHMCEGEAKKFSTPSEWVYEGSISEDCTVLTSSEALSKRDAKGRPVPVGTSIIQEYLYKDELPD